MLKNCNNKKVILFPVGASGNFLTALVTTGKINVLPNHRIDLGQTISSAIMIHGDESPDKRFVDVTSDRCLANIKDAIVNDPHQVIMSHYLGVSQLREFADTCWIRKISPITNKFGWIKNVYSKKQTVEQTDYTNTSFRYQVDIGVLEIAQLYEMQATDTDLPSDMTIDFGKLSDIEFLKELYASANGEDIDSMRLEFAKNYIGKQGKAVDDCDSKNLADIIKHVDPQDAFDVATVLFIYEKNHNTVDKNRLWTIDDLPNSLSDSLEFLVSNADNYTIFKG